VEVDLERVQSRLVRTTGGRFIAGSGPTWSLQGRGREPGGMVDQVHAGPSWAVLGHPGGHRWWSVGPVGGGPDVDPEESTGADHILRKPEVAVVAVPVQMLTR
jgi:hypothetical protein